MLDDMSSESPFSTAAQARATATAPNMIAARRSWRFAAISRASLAWVTCLMWCCVLPSVAFTNVASTRASHLYMAAPGVELAPSTEIRTALQNPASIIVDARSMEELQANGYYTGCESGQAKGRWVHAPSTGPPNPSSPLLTLASASLLPDLHAPIIVHCGSGIRAGIVKTILEDLGYTNVMNAGGLVDLEFAIAG